MCAPVQAGLGVMLLGVCTMTCVLATFTVVLCVWPLIKLTIVSSDYFSYACETTKSIHCYNNIITHTFLLCYHYGEF